MTTTKGLAALELYRRYVRKCNLCGKKVLSGTPLDWMLDPELIPKFLRPLKVGVVANQLNADGTHRLDDEKHVVMDAGYHYCDRCSELVELSAHVKELWIKYDVNKGQGYSQEDSIFRWVSQTLDRQISRIAKGKRRVRRR